MVEGITNSKPPQFTIAVDQDVRLSQQQIKNVIQKLCVLLPTLVNQDNLSQQSYPS